MGWGENRGRVLAALPTEPDQWTTVESVSDATGFSVRTARKHLYRLWLDGLVVAEDNDTFWRAADPPP